MKTLKEKYCHKKALFICGGPSMMTNFSLIKNIDRKKYVIFLETKALTPKFIELGIEPDFIFLCFPDKAKDNSLQHYIYRSFLASRPIKHFLKNDLHPQVDYIQAKFDTYYEDWDPSKKSKRYKYKPDVYLNDSPYDLLRHYPKCKIIAREDLFYESFPNFKYLNKVYFYSSASSKSSVFELNQYFNPSDIEAKTTISFNPFLNSAAIAIYPLLSYMGFKEIFLLGMDMNIMGNMEFSALKTFKSLLHFHAYFRLCYKAFNADYRINKPFYLRPKSEFLDLKELLKYDKIKFYRIHNSERYSAPINYIKTIKYEEFF